MHGHCYGYYYCSIEIKWECFSYHSDVKIVIKLKIKVI
jgi:hypothetical protein